MRRITELGDMWLGMIKSMMKMESIMENTTMIIIKSLSLRTGSFRRGLSGKNCMKRKRKLRKKRRSILEKAKMKRRRRVNILPVLVQSPSNITEKGDINVTEESIPKQRMIQRTLWKKVKSEMCPNLANQESTNSRNLWPQN